MSSLLPQVMESESLPYNTINLIRKQKEKKKNKGQKQKTKEKLIKNK